MKKISCKLPRNIEAFELDHTDRAHTFSQQYIENIRSYHYIEKNGWETSGEDQYDQHSTVLVVVDRGQVVVGCRIIKDNLYDSLPIRETLRESNKPVWQIPPGSIEVSRFGIDPTFLGKRAISVYLNYFISAVTRYMEMNGHDVVYAVLISILEKCFDRSKLVDVERLPQGTSSTHGESLFHTVKLIPRWSNPIPIRKVA